VGLRRPGGCAVRASAAGCSGFAVGWRRKDDGETRVVREVDVRTKIHARCAMSLWMGDVRGVGVSASVVEWSSEIGLDMARSGVDVCASRGCTHGHRREPLGGRRPLRVIPGQCPRFPPSATTPPPAPLRQPHFLPPFHLLPLSYLLPLVLAVRAVDGAVLFDKAGGCTGCLSLHLLHGCFMRRVLCPARFGGRT
jgi:hypothetical protein